MQQWKPAAPANWGSCTGGQDMHHSTAIGNWMFVYELTSDVTCRAATSFALAALYT